jgi:acyl dehydratase
MRWYEEIEPGESLDLGAFRFTAEAIVDFARQYDPQPFHLSEEAAQRSLFGHLAASGWQTAAVWMKLFVARMDAEASRRRADDLPAPRFGPSPGFENMKWIRPVLAGDTIAYRSHFVAKRSSASRPDWGIVTMRHEGLDPAGTLVFEFTGAIFVPMRPASPVPADQSLARST